MHSLRWLAFVSLLPVACGDDVPSGGGSSTDDGTSTSVGTSTGTSTTEAASSTDDVTGSTTAPDESSSGGSSSSDSSGGGGSSSSGTVVCDENEFGPACTPCTCVNGACDDGAQGTGACTCEEGWLGETCDEIDCGPGGTFEDGGCSTPLVAVEDAQVVSGDVSAMNFGSEEFTPYGVGLQSEITGGQIGRALIKFDLNDVPADAVVDGATLRVKEFDNFTAFPMTLVVKAADSVWGEGDVTWDTQPAFDDTTLDSSDVGCCGEVHDLDVTATVLAALDDAEIEVTFELQSDDETVADGVRWFMREGEGVNINGIIGEPPLLIVHWTPR
jgi:hypothetical protein